MEQKTTQLQLAGSSDAGKEKWKDHEESHPTGGFLSRESIPDLAARNTRGE